jgi:ParB family chromosome partitioning protein
VAGEQTVTYVAVADINVPRERVTSVWDPAIQEEFLESVRTKGILEPVTLMRIDGQLWLIDGLHRLEAAEKLRMDKVPAIVIEGSLEELLIQNIIRNRQRGKSNPAQEAEVLALLVEKKGYPLEMAAKQLGMSESWAKKLLKISFLPDQVKDQLKHGKIPVTGAFYLADLPRPEDQIAVAKDAEFYNYNAEQIKRRVWQILNPDVEPEPGEITFTPEGKPARVPLTCHFCGAVLSETDSYVWICAECLSLARDTIDYYHKTYTQKPVENQPSQTPE